MTTSSTVPTLVYAFQRLGSAMTLITVVMCLMSRTAMSYTSFFPERDYVTFGSLLSQIRLSSVVCLSVCLSATLVHPTQGFEPFGNISSPCIRRPSCDLLAKFYGDRPRGTPPSEALNARGVANYSDFGPIEGYIS